MVAGETLLCSFKREEPELLRDLFEYLKAKVQYLNIVIKKTGLHVVEQSQKDQTKIFVNLYRDVFYDFKLEYEDAKFRVDIDHLHKIMCMAEKNCMVFVKCFVGRMEIQFKRPEYDEPSIFNIKTTELPTGTQQNLDDHITRVNNENSQERIAMLSSHWEKLVGLMYSVGTHAKFKFSQDKGDIRCNIKASGIMNFVDVNLTKSPEEQNENKIDIQLRGTTNSMQYVSKSLNDAKGSKLAKTVEVYMARGEPITLKFAIQNRTRRSFASDAGFLTYVISPQDLDSSSEEEDDI